MDNINHITGKVTVSDRAVKQLAVYAAKKCAGVAGMSDKSRAGEAVRVVTGNGDVTGVYVTKTKTGIMLEMYIACTYGADTKAVAQSVEDSVKNAFPVTGITVRDVDVHINDVR